MLQSDFRDVQVIRRRQQVQHGAGKVLRLDCRQLVEVFWSNGVVTAGLEDFRLGNARRKTLKYFAMEVNELR